MRPPAGRITGKAEWNTLEGSQHPLLTKKGSTEMNSPEQHLLSILRAGDMIRFVLIAGAQGKLDFSVEGAPAAEDNGMMAERLALALRALRDAGFDFNVGGESTSLPSVRRGSRKHPLKSMLEIRPHPLLLSGLSEGVLGFSSEYPTSARAVTLPSFHAFEEIRLFRSVANVLLEVPEIMRFEVEFTRFDLPGACVKPLERVLTLHSLSGVVPEDRPSKQRAFLSLWLLHRSGWRVKARAWTGPQVPSAALEIIGRDIFSCDCDVLSSKDISPGEGDIDLSACYPRGWHFLSILPPPEVFSKLAASRLHNSSLPDLPRAGFQIGTADGEEVRLPQESRDRHNFICGATGSGKSTLLQRMIVEDIKRGEGVILLDPHGDLFRAVREAVPKNREKDVFIIDPEMNEKPPGLNILDIPQSPFRNRHAAFVVGELLGFFSEMWNMRSAGGPMFELYFRNTILLMCLIEKAVPESQEKDNSFACKGSAEEVLQKLLSDEVSETKETPAEEIIQLPLNLSHFSRVLVDKKFRESLLERCSDKSVVEFWKDVAVKAGGECSLANMVPYIISKINGMVQSGFVADLLCAQRNKFRLAGRMRRGEIILINLNKGLLGGHESRLLGTILMMEIFAAGLQRSVLKEEQRRPVNVYVDEFQNFVSDNVAVMLSEARKFGLRLTLANQTLAQLKANPGRQDLLETVLGNVGTMILFRLGVPDADRLRLFTEPFTRQEMQDLPNYHALVRLLSADGPLRPLVMKTMPA